jgi:hypothetical protein
MNNRDEALFWLAIAAILISACLCGFDPRVG